MDKNNDDNVPYNGKPTKYAIIAGETDQERIRRLGRERRNRWFANRTEQQLAEIRRTDLERRRKRLAQLKQAALENCTCFHCSGSESITTDINEIKFSSNGQMYTLGDCYTLITGIKIESGQSVKQKICQMCQNQLIVIYNMKRQYLKQQEPTIKNENPLVTSLPDLGTPIMPPIEHSKNQCTICMKRFDGVLPYRRHMKTHSDQYVCEHCGFKTTDKPQMREHLLTHSEDYACCVCNEKFPTNNLRKRHLKLKHIVSSVGATELAAADLGIKIQCNYCGVFVYKSGIHSHLRLHEKNSGTAHSKSPPEITSEVYDSDDSSHQYQEEKPSTIEDNLKCSRCPKIFTLQLYLDRHMATVHSNNLSYKCDTCSNSYITEQKLLDHQATHTGEHECQICHARFATLRAIYHHIKKIHKETCFKCPVPNCGEVLASKALQDHHANLHSSAFAVSCMVCDRAFDTFFALYDHYGLKHRLAKSVYNKGRQDNCMCLLCGKQFSILSFLKFHIVAKSVGTRHSTDCRYCHQTRRKNTN